MFLTFFIISLLILFVCSLLTIIFYFNRTVYVLLGSLAAYMFAIGLLFYCGMEFLGLVFLIILVGGISVMFLFILLIIDVRAENSKKLFFFDFSFSLSIFISFFLVSLFLYFYLCQLNPKLSYEIFFNVVAFNNINEIYIISVLLLSKHHILLLLVGFLLFLATITALILSVNVFEKDL